MHCLPRPSSAGDSCSLPAGRTSVLLLLFKEMNQTAGPAAEGGGRCDAGLRSGVLAC